MAFSGRDEKDAQRVVETSVSLAKPGGDMQIRSRASKSGHGPADIWRRSLARGMQA
jgi:hypothetical protein